MENTKRAHYERPVIKPLGNHMPGKSGAGTAFAPVTHIDNVAVKDIVAKFGSPVFVISEKTIRETYQRAVKAFSSRYPKVQFAWSYKTNYLNAVCNVFHQEGSWAEVVSGFEYKKALKNGVPGKRIIFNGPDKTPEDHLMAIENGSMIH
ncbi:diaminopimelate decarboxylase, partial [bacterium]|nr:diaminopimelate decarboxylase [bacterium]